MKLYEGKRKYPQGRPYGSAGTDRRRRLEVLGMLEGTRITVVNRKKKGAMIINIRGTRFAVGQCITECIEVEEI